MVVIQRLMMKTVVESIGAQNGNLFFHVLDFQWELAMFGDFLIWPMKMAVEHF